MPVKEQYQGYQPLGPGNCIWNKAEGAGLRGGASPQQHETRRNKVRAQGKGAGPEQATISRVSPGRWEPAGGPWARRATPAAPGPWWPPSGSRRQ